MGVLDDAIKEHLELKRRHGVPEEEVQRQEEEALGPARRDVAQQPEETELAPGQPATAEAGDGEAAAESQETALFDMESPAGEAAPMASAVDGPEAPVIDAPGEPGEPHADQPAMTEPTAAEPPAPQLAQPPIAEPSVSDFAEPASESAPVPDEPPASMEPAEPVEEPSVTEPASVEEPPAAEEPPPTHEPPSFEEPPTAVQPPAAGLAPQGEAPPVEPPPVEPPLVDDPVGEPGDEPDPDDRLGDTQPHGFDALDEDDEGEGAGEDVLASDPEDEELDVLEDTPDFLQETPEHDRLWFEQKPPRDFDFD